MSDKRDDEDRPILPMGFSKQEHGGASLSPVDSAKCPECEEGHIGHNISKSSSWGSPSSPATAYCRECGARYKLALVKEE